MYEHIEQYNMYEHIQQSEMPDLPPAAEVGSEM